MLPTTIYSHSTLLNKIPISTKPIPNHLNRSNPALTIFSFLPKNAHIHYGHAHQYTSYDIPRRMTV